MSRWVVGFGLCTLVSGIALLAPRTVDACSCFPTNYVDHSVTRDFAMPSSGSNGIDRGTWVVFRTPFPKLDANRLGDYRLIDERTNRSVKVTTTVADGWIRIKPHTTLGPSKWYRVHGPTRYTVGGETIKLAGIVTRFKTGQKVRKAFSPAALRVGTSGVGSRDGLNCAKQQIVISLNSGAPADNSSHQFFWSLELYEDKAWRQLQSRPAWGASLGWDAPVHGIDLQDGQLLA